MHIAQVDRNLASDIVATMEGVDISFLRDVETTGVEADAAAGDELAPTLSSAHPRQVEIIRLVKDSETWTENEDEPRMKIAKTTEISAVKRPGSWRQEKLVTSSSALLNKAPKDGSPDVERVSTGTKYALALWLTQLDRVLP